MLLQLSAASPTGAANGDCGQPTSSGSKPTASDALTVLKAAVGQTTCALHICDVDNNSKITAPDALRVLRIAVGQNLTLNCPAPASTVDLACGVEAGTITLKTGFGEEVLDLSADLTLRCDDPAEGGGNCQCIVNNIDPIHLTSFGVVCATPTDRCSSGSLDCDGGSPKESQFVSDHDAGSCTGNANCATTCDSYCSNIGKTRMSSNCEGFCVGGANAGGACNALADCPGSHCFGIPLSHGNICSCHCAGNAGSAAAPGHFQCQVGLYLTFEFEAPCDGTDQLFIVADQCLTLTSESLDATIKNANAQSAEINVDALSGASQTCPNLASDGTAGLSMVGVIPMTDTPSYGDIIATLNLPCE